MKFDVIVVLAGGITDQGTLPEGVMKRILVAKKFYDTKRSSKILMSGKWSAYWDHIPPKKTEAELMADYALSLGIPKKAILTEENSQNTFQNAFYISKLFLEPNSWKKVVVITTSYHLPRARKIFTDLLGKKYQFYFVEAEEDEGFGKRMRRRVKELIFSCTQWFFQYFLYRH